MKFDTIIKNGTVILEDKAVIMDIGIKDGLITKLEKHLEDAKTLYDATGFIVSPGMVDAHVHITEPASGYRDDWEGYLTGTAAASKGGVTSIIEMPLNQIPATVDKASFDIKIQAGLGKLAVDVASYGGLVPFNLDQGIKELDKSGVVAYKCFIATCGDRAIEGDFMNVDDFSLYQGMKEIAKTGKVLAIHAENAGITDKLGEIAYKKGLKTMADYVATRPVFTEIEPIQKAILFAKETGCRIHICHVACHEGIELINRAQKEGVDVTCETCTHYLVFDTSQLNDIGPVVKCSPPIRDKDNQDKMWYQILNNQIDFITSDHSPCTPDLKDKDNAFEAWGGIAGLQNNVDILFDEAVLKRQMDLVDFAKIIATNPANRFGLTQKGKIAIGMDADLVLIDPNNPYTLKSDDLEYRHKISPYINRKINAQVEMTFLRGHCIYSKQQGLSETRFGQFI